MGRALIAAAVMALAMSASAGPAFATLCTGDRSVTTSLAAGDLAFVGVVESTRNLDRWATFRVEEVWSVGDLPGVVEVRGSRAEPAFLDLFSNVTSSDRNYEQGEKYLVFPLQEDGHLLDEICSSTQLWTAELEQMRPSTVHPPSAGGRAQAPSAVGWAAIVTTLSIGGGLVLWTARRRDQPTS
jgi:hypothetical protein